MDEINKENQGQNSIKAEDENAGNKPFDGAIIDSPYFNDEAIDFNNVKPLIDDQFNISIEPTFNNNQRINDEPLINESLINDEKPKTEENEIKEEHVSHQFIEQTEKAKTNIENQDRIEEPAEPEVHREAETMNLDEANEDDLVQNSAELENIELHYDPFEHIKIDRPITIEENNEEVKRQSNYIKYSSFVNGGNDTKFNAELGIPELKYVTSEPTNVKSEKIKVKPLNAKKLKADKKPKKIKTKKVKVKKEKIKKVKDTSNRPKANKSTFVFAIIVSIVLFFGVCGVGAAGIFAYSLCQGMPELNVADLVSPDSSTIYDNEGNKIMEVGMYLRENIDYEELPNCVIDAFLASEDSRYFEHAGFDIPRFTKALISYVKQGGEISSGGSTITMQLIKNSYFSIDADDESTVAAREGMSGIKRKMQEIVLAIKLSLSGDVSKQETLAMFVNKVNYGNNIRGIEKAAEYYFGKSAKDLNVGEAAFLAGIINAPNTYNPYNNLEKYDSIYLDPDSDYLANATQRRNSVLDLMVQHGYISETEANLYKSVRIEDMVCGITNRFSETNEKYQWYIDAVIDEVEEMTGESPYDVGMEIYTNMNPYMQELMYEIQNNEEVIEFPNELCQSAVILMDNQTGAVEAIGGGRGERTEARQFNRATSAYLNPGSTFKPVIDYSLAIEYLGWSTAHTITDQPYYLYDGPALISNYDHTYHGDMLMTEALGRSQNTPAVQTLAAVCDKIGEDKVVDYLNSIGFNIDYSDFDLQFAIGGNQCLVTPLQLAGAHAIFMNDGYYIKPHTINYIKYVDGREDYVADTVGTQVLSDATAWMTAYLEYYNMEGPYASLMQYCLRDYPLYGKTGTTDWGTSGEEYGIPESATKDSWLVMQTNRYTISCWTGYDELEEGAYFTNAEYQENTKSKIVSLILDELETHASYEDYDPSVELAKPDSVKEISFQRGTFPYVTSNPEITGYIWDKWIDENTGTLEEALAYSASKKKWVDAGISGITGTYDGNQVNVTFTLSQGTGGLLSGENTDLSSSNVYNETTGASGTVWFPHWETIYLGTAEPPYYYNVYVNDVLTASGSTDNTSFSASAPGGTSCKVEMWTTNPEHPMSVEITIG